MYGVPRNEFGVHRGSGFDTLLSRNSRHAVAPQLARLYAAAPLRIDEASNVESALSYLMN